VDKLKQQSSKVGDLVFSAETGSTYQKALGLTWDIVRETGILLWLVVCLLFVGAEGFWKLSVSLGRKTRNWYEGLQAPSEEEPKSASEMGQSVLSALGSSTETLLYQAKQQLGMKAEPPAPKPQQPPKSAPKAMPQPKSPAPAPDANSQAAIAAAAEKAAEKAAAAKADEASDDDE